jgi:hypothetical protein
MLIDVAISVEINVIQKEAEKILNSRMMVVATTQTCQNMK